MTSPSLRLFAAGKTAPPRRKRRNFPQGSCRLGQYPAQADGGLACGGIPCTAPTSWEAAAGDDQSQPVTAGSQKACRHLTC
jgi:hypothetical protein